MSFYDAIRVGASGAADFEIERSLRFNRSDSTYLTKSLGSTSNRRTFTYSFWVKRTVQNEEQCLIYNGHPSSTPYGEIRFEYQGSNIHELNFYSYDGSIQFQFRTKRVFRDPSAWYHIVLALDTTQSTQSDRVKIYVNGEQETTFTTATYPSQNVDTGYNVSGNTHSIGGFRNTSNSFDGYVAELNFIDGLQLTPSSFAETNADTGQWVPIDTSGLTFGTNGFRLNFADNSGTTATTLGKDTSGNGNNYTPNNFVTGDAVKDSPTNNFSTLRFYGTPAASGASLSEGNLRFVSGTSGSARNLNRSALSTIMPTSGKWYAEVKIISYSSSSAQTFIGVAPYQVLITPTSTNSRWVGIYGDDGDKYVNTNGSETNSSYGSASTQNDIMGVYIDMDASTPEVYFAKNGQWGNGSGSWNQSTPTSAITLGNSFFTESTGGFEGIGLYLFSGSGSFNVTLHANFGQDSTFSGGNTAGGNTDASGIGDFKYAVPTGAKAMCSANLPDPTILLPNKHFDILLWSGNSTNNRAITGLEFQPDFVWIKARTVSIMSHYLVYSLAPYTDSGTGNGNVGAFVSGTNATDAEGTTTDAGFESFDSNGYTFGKGNNDANSNSAYQRMNASGRTYVGWNWDAGETDGATYRVVVVSDSGNKYRFRNSANSATFAQSAVTLDLAEGGTYIFNMDDSTNASHPFSIGTAANGTVYTSGITYFLDGVSKTYSQYTSGFSSATTRRLHITVPASAPQLYYWCSAHSGMGGSINTNTTLGSSNFDGSIQSTAKANTTAGFSIVTYTGNGTGGATIGHGLGVKPNWIIAKDRSANRSWAVGSDESPWTLNLRLDENSTPSNTSQSKNQWYETTPTSTVFYVGDGDVGDFSGDTNVNTENYVAFCFSEVAGYSKFGKYIANGNADGTFVLTGFRPAWILIKKISSSVDWILFDTKRYDTNRPHGSSAYLFPNLSDAEATTENIDILSNGFKPRAASGYFNSSAGHEFIYFAFAEAPFKYARAR
tara:strand:- start:1659 stop:4664 length:3006 start_codon:yes stop_codon:yes gene_type:complete